METVIGFTAIAVALLIGLGALGGGSRAAGAAGVDIGVDGRGDRAHRVDAGGIDYLPVIRDTLADKRRAPEVAYRIDRFSRCQAVRDVDMEEVRASIAADSGKDAAPAE